MAKNSSGARDLEVSGSDRGRPVSRALKLSLDWLLVFVPLTVAIRYFRPDAETLIFLTVAIAIIPLAGWLGRATEELADRTNECVGGLLNATFGNASELIIALMALQHGWARW